MLTRSVTSSASQPALARGAASRSTPARRPTSDRCRQRPLDAHGRRRAVRGDGARSPAGSRRRRSRRCVPVATGATTDGVPPRLAGVGVGEVQLDDRAVERGERVVERPRVVGERAGVDDDGRAPAPRGVDRVDQLALVVGLEVLDGRGRARPPPRGGRDVVVERGGAVDVGLALAQQVEVGPVQQQHDRDRSRRLTDQLRAHGLERGVDRGPVDAGDGLDAVAGRRART